MPDPQSPPAAPAPSAGHGLSKLGLVLFAIYLVVYGGFVALAAFASGVIAQLPFGGVNLAIIYGFVLIVAPLILAVIYLLAAPAGADRDGG